MAKQDVLNLLGFAQKSGKVVSGETQLKAVMKKRQVFLLIMAEDLALNRRKHWSYWAQECGVPSIVLGKKQELGIAIGLSPRSIVGVTDLLLAKSMEKKL